MEYSGQVYQPTEVVITVGQSRAKLFVNILASYIIVTSLMGICGLALLGSQLTDNDDFSEVINEYIVAMALIVIRLILGVALVVGNVKGITWILYTWLGLIGFELVSFLIASILGVSDGSLKRFFWQMSMAILLSYAIRVLHHRLIEVKLERRIKSYMACAVQQLVRNQYDEPPQYETVVETKKLVGQ